jgi:hypothetical protein
VPAGSVPQSLHLSHAITLYDKLRRPKLPAALAAKCFPDLLQHGGSQPVQLYITEATEDGTESTPVAAGKRW